MKLKITFLFTLMCALMVNFSFAQEKLVSGVVRDAQGVIPGVNVVVKGSTRSVQTNDKGKFAISVKVGEVLQFSFIGMETKEVTVGSSSEIKVTLSDAATALKDVVVNVGYQSVKKGSITGSVSVVGSKEIENRPIASFDQILQGSAPGLVVMAGSGQPGSPASVQIRGTHSINGSSTPMYILDGIPIGAGDFATLNPNDFENVSVLKDAASTSIYGTRGSNGVILITSKKGKYNSATSFTVKSQYGFSQVGNNPVSVMNAEQKMIFENYRTPGTYSDADLAWAKNNSTDWSKYFFRTGETKTFELGASGGSENTRFYTSLSYYDQQGISLRSDLKRFTYRLNLENKASEKIKLGTNVQIGFSKQNLISGEGVFGSSNPLSVPYLGNPLMSPYRPDGSFNTGAPDTANAIDYFGGNNLEHLLNNKRNTLDFKMVGNFWAEVSLLKNLTYRPDFGVDYSGSRFMAAASPKTYNGLNSVGQQGYYTEDNSFSATLNFNQRLKYERTFAEKHNVSTMIATEYVKIHSMNGSFTGYGLNEKTFGYANSITVSPTLLPGVDGSDYEEGLFSYFLNSRYTYNDKYTIDGTIRRDASSKFSIKNKWGTFYAVGLNWNLMAENFIKSQEWIEDLRLRASYGTTGNKSGIAPFNDENTWATSSYAGNPGISVGRMANESLVWETSQKLNIGLDFSFFKSVISGNLDVYQENVVDLFIDQPLPAYALNGSLDINAGKMSNKGYDLSLKALLVKSKNPGDFSLNLYGNTNYNKNNIDDLGQVTEYNLGTSVIRVGLPFGSHYSIGWAGVNPANGQPLYLDKNGNVTTVFSTANYTANWGTNKPLFTGGFGSEFSYKGFTVNAFFTFAADYHLYNNQNQVFENNSFKQYNASTTMLTIWRKPGDVTNVPGFGNPFNFSSKDIEDASFTRLRNITISYTLPKSFIQNNKYFSLVRLYIQAQNLYTWTNYNGFDPENDSNISKFDYPTPKTTTIGLDLKF